MLPKFKCRLASRLRANVRLRNLLHGMKAGPVLLLSPLLWNEPFGQGQRAGQVPAGLLANVHASGRERLEHRSHSRLLADIARSAVESPQSPNGDARSFPVALRG